MLHSDVILLIETVASMTGRSPNTVGRLAAGSGDFYSRLKDGHDLTTGRAATVVQYLADHWPPDLAWPTSIPRPKPSKADGKEAA